MSTPQVSVDSFSPMREFFNEQAENLFTAIPAHVKDFNPSTQTATIELSIMAHDFADSEYETPPIIECPVHFPGDSYVLEMQITAGCEGLAVFSQRCIDGWLQTGGGKQVTQYLHRCHDMQDCFFIPGFRPNPVAISGFKNNGIRIRDKSGSKYVWIKTDGTIESTNGAGSIVIESSGKVVINKNFVIDTSGNGETTGTIKATTDVIGAGISLKSHVHTGVDSGSSNTGGPV